MHGVDVFISYSRDDKDKVAVLARMIASEGYEVWWDADLPPHMSYGDVITAKIGAAKAAVVVWSDTAAKSEWVRAEADVARNQKKLIQTALDNTMPPLPFNQIQCAEIGDWNGEPDHRGWSKVKQSLVALCGPRDAERRDAAQVPLSASVAAAAPSTPAGKKPKAPADTWPDRTAKKGMSTPLMIALGCGGLAVLGVVMVIALAALGMSFEDTGDMSDIDADEYSAPLSELNDGDDVSSPESDIDGDFIPQLEQQPDQAPQAESLADQPAMMQTLLVATVQDPDGYTNVRAGPSSNSAIIGRVDVGDVFTTYQQNTLWWSVQLEDGTEGYIYNNRISVIGPQ